jgi:hypothetical protein
VRVFLVPLVLVLPESEASTEVLVHSCDPIPYALPPSGEEWGDPAAWIQTLVAPRLDGVEAISRFQTLEVRPVPPQSLYLTVWAAGRSTGGEARPLEETLATVGMRFRDPTFARSALSAIRRALVADPFLSRALGESARLRAAGEVDVPGAAGRETPAVIGLLPSTFSLAELHRAVASLVGRPANELESASNFRRRIQELVHRDVLVEDNPDPSPADRERTGRPPRHFRFNPEGWRRWLLMRAAGDLDETSRSLHDQLRRLENASGSTVFRRKAAEAEAAGLEAARRERDPSGLDPALFSQWLSPLERRWTPELGTESRLSRLERLLEDLLLERKRPPAEP